MKVYVPRTILLDGREVEALVPIEAEEETIAVQTRGQAHPEWRTRLVTLWTTEEEA